MRSRLIPLLLFCLAALTLSAQAAPPTVTVRFVATGKRDRGLSAGAFFTSETRAAGEHWARIGPENFRLPETSPEKVVEAVGASDGNTSAGLEIVNPTAEPVRLRLETVLPEGLWAVDAALGVGVAESASAPSPLRLWRMESVLRSSDGLNVKQIEVPAGAALFMRWTETVVQAGQARQQARVACWHSDNHTMQNRVAPALDSIENTLETLSVLVERGDRAKIIKRVHTALLATAKAQAVWQNWREPTAEGEDRAFEALTTALSEVSCAACNLVPSQTMIPGEDGKSLRVRLSLTNAGKQAIPLVSLGLVRRKDGTPSSDRTVFRGLAPGAQVAATFALSDEGEAVGNIQFICGMGAAVVFARPAAPLVENSTQESNQ